MLENSCDMQMPQYGGCRDIVGSEYTHVYLKFFFLLCCYNVSKSSLDYVMAMTFLFYYRACSYGNVLQAEVRFQALRPGLYEVCVILLIM